MECFHVTVNLMIGTGHFSAKTVGPHPTQNGRCTAFRLADARPRVSIPQGLRPTVNSFSPN